MRKVWAAAMITTLLVASASCRREEQKNERGTDALRLYQSTMRLARIAADSIRNSADSASATEAFERLSNNLDSLNFSVEADTDLMLTEGENDTIFMQLMTVRKIYENKLRSLVRKVEEEPTETKQPN